MVDPCAPLVRSHGPVFIAFLPKPDSLRSDGLPILTAQEPIGEGRSMKGADMRPRYAGIRGSAFGLAVPIATGARASFLAGHACAQGAAPASEVAAQDAGVAAALRRMAMALAGAPELTVRLTGLRETPIRPGSDQPIMVSGTMAVGIQRPDQLAALVGSDRGSFRLW
jgi:hypothetical protein